jgi:hypothetical protein
MGTGGNEGQERRDRWNGLDMGPLILPRDLVALVVGEGRIRAAIGCQFGRLFDIAQAQFGLQQIDAFDGEAHVRAPRQFGQ